MSACNICGGEEFVPGPNDRLSESGDPPRCVGCYYLEWHRQLRACLELLARHTFSWRRAIQFVPDPSLDPDWFSSFERSQFQEENSLDLQEIAHPSSTYDFISLSSVFEFVRDDRLGFSELARIASPECVIHHAFTPSAENVPTQHYDKPRGSFGRRHLYGRDLTEWLQIETYGLIMVKVSATSVTDPIHFFCRRQDDAETLTDTLTHQPVTSP